MPKYVTRMAKSGESESYAVKDAGAREAIAAEAEARQQAVSGEAEARAQAVTAEAEARAEAIYDLQDALNNQEVTYKSLTPAYETGKIGSDGSIIADDSLRHIPFTDISNYSIVKIVISTQSGYIAFYTSDKTFISSINQADYTVGRTQSFIKPENAAYFMFTASVYASISTKEFYVSEYYLPYKVLEMENQYNSIIHDLATSDGFDSIIPVYSSGKIDSNGSVSADPSVYCTEHINILNYAYAAFVVSTDAGHMAFYDSNKQFISSIALNTKTIGKLTLFKKPNQAAYYRTTVSTWHATNNQPVYKRFSYATLEDFPHVYYVEKDGKGDFSSLVDAIREAIKYKNSTVYVGDGTWDIIEELGQEYISGVYVGQRGLYLENGIHVICSSKSIIKCEYTGDLDEVKTWLSAFNSGPLGFTLENATIVGKNIRYVIHDERDYTDPDLYINKYINCKMYLDNSENTAWDNMQVIGGGLGINGYIEINGCYFESAVVSSQTAPYVITAWHNSQDLNNLNAKSRLEIKNSYFAGQNCTFRITGMGNSSEVSTVFISGCSLGAAPIKAGTDNVSLVSWSNEIRNN